MTDETFDRVAKKVREVRPGYKGDPKAYFYAIAWNLIKEESKKAKRYASLDDIDPPAKAVDKTEHETAEMREECLQSCLKKLDAEKRELIRNYYAKEKQAKIDHRAQLAKQLGTNVETLRVRVYRIRQTLVECVDRCIDRKTRQR